MTRLGCVLLLFFVLVIGGFALLVKHGGAPKPEVATVPSAGPARLLIPVAGVAARQLTDTWGQSRAAGAREHDAIDILARRGTPVVAAAAGTVEKIFESKDGGHTIYIRRTEPAWIDYYAHLDTYAPDLREGVPVRAGERLGTVGSSGNASPDAPHLHYEIKRMAPGEKWWQGYRHRSLSAADRREVRGGVFALARLSGATLFPATRPT